MKHKRAQRGLSLIEILVALVVSMILLAGVIQIFISTRQSYGVLEDFSRIQENGRFAIDHLGRVVREAGYVGCATGTVGSITNTLNDTDDFEWNFTEAIRGYEYTGTGPGDTYAVASATPAACGGACDTSDWTSVQGGAVVNAPASVAQYVVPGSDILGIRLALGGGVALVDPYNNGAQLFADNVPGLNTDPDDECPDGTDMYSGLCQEDILVVSDCEKARVFQASNLTGTGGGGTPAVNVPHSSASMTPGNDISSWGGSSAPDEERFMDGSFILKMSTFAFFIGVGENGGPALMRRVNDGLPEELVENVESFQVLYGEDTTDDGDANVYRPADEVSDFANVVSVRLSILVSGPDEVAPEADTGTYDLSGTILDPVANNRLRRHFTAVIRLRNRGLQKS